jgi:hypothetical protein
VRYDHLQGDDGETESEVERDRSERAETTEALERGVPQALNREGGDADAVREPYGRAAAKKPHGAEREYRRRGDRGQRDRQLSPGDRAELRGVQASTELKALPETMRINVCNPEDEHGGDDDGDEVPEVVLEGLPSGRQGGQDDDRSVDSSRDASPGSEDKPRQRLSSAHRRIMRQSPSGMQSKGRQAIWENRKP